MIDAASLSAYAPAIEALAETSGLMPFARFWRCLLDASVQHLMQGGEQADAVKESLRVLLEFLESGMPSDDASSLRAKLLGTSPCLVPHTSLPGDPDDPSTPLGLFSLMNPLAESKAASFPVYLPYTLTLLESLLQGPGVVVSSVHALHPDVDDKILQEVAALVSRVRDLLGASQVEALCRVAIHATDELFMRTPFLAFMHAQDFYRFGSRFYGQGELDYFKCGLTSGFVIPEDYYGRQVYEMHGPGITQDRMLGPGNFQDSGIANHDVWNKLVLAGVFGSEGATSGPLNPHRPIYFDSALKRIEERGGSFHNIIDVEQTGERLRERAEFWSERGQLDAYLDDSATILDHFLRHPATNIYFARSLDAAWRSGLPAGDPASSRFLQAPIAAPYLVSLLSDRISVYTARGKLRAINRGFWVNPTVLEYFEPSSRYGWELIPFYLLGLDKAALRGVLAEKGDRRTYWLSRFIHDPTRALFSNDRRVSVPSKDDIQSVKSQARQIVDELLRPNLTAITRATGRPFLTLHDLTEVFGRSYGRLRHWISEYNLGAYSVQAHDHRFSRESLRTFVQTELAGRRGFGEAKVSEILLGIDRLFSRPRMAR
jgi:hypothetical protein